MTVWREFSTGFDPEFVAYVEQMLRESSGQSSSRLSLIPTSPRSSSIARPCAVLIFSQSRDRPRRYRRIHPLCHDAL